jgi:N utilization substance protein B
MTTPSGGSRWQGRQRAREAALQMLYQTEIGQLSVAEAVGSHGAIAATETIDLDEDARDYAVALARGSWLDRQVIDQYIAGAAHNWRVERLTVIDRLLLRLAVHELLSHPATPPRVVIDEAIELARTYSGEDAAKFVNGVLDGVFRKLKEEGKVVE